MHLIFSFLELQEKMQTRWCIFASIQSGEWKFSHSVSSYNSVWKLVGNRACEMFLITSKNILANLWDYSLNSLFKDSHCLAIIHLLLTQQIIKSSELIGHSVALWSRYKSEPGIREFRLFLYILACRGISGGQSEMRTYALVPYYIFSLICIT